MKTVFLPNGMTTTVDNQDYEKVVQWKDWYVLGGRVARKSARIGTPGRKTVYMHRLIMSPKDGMVVDHIDGNALNNQRSNMRVCTSHQNKMNRHKVRGSSKYKGACWDKSRNKWLSQITSKGKRMFLGYFDNEEDAAIVYDVAAQLFHGEYAKLNFPLKQ